MATFGNRAVSPAGIALLTAMSLLSLATFSIPAASASGPSGVNPCPSQPYYSSMGDYESTPTTIPDIDDPSTTYPGIALKPTDTATYPGKRPVIVLQHGLHGNRCGEFWKARILAGHGFVVATHSSPDDSNAGIAFSNAVKATKSDFAFMESPGNPYAAVSDTSRLGIGGHSMGSSVTSLLQGDPDLHIDAGVAQDNLKRWISGDPGAAGESCNNAPSVEVTPAVPVMGLAKDEPCSADSTSYPDLKLPGFSWWREHQVPSMELVMRGFTHSTFGSSEEHQKLVTHFMLAWFRLYLNDDSSQLDTLLSPTIDGQPTVDVLSQQYNSAAYIDPAVDTTDFSTWLKAPHPPATDPDPPAAKLTTRIRSFGKARPGKRFRVRVKVKNTGNKVIHDVRLRPMVTHWLSWRPHDVILKSVKPGQTKVHDFSIHVRGSAPRGQVMSVRILTFKGWSSRKLAPKVKVFRTIR